eukprot:1140418-Prymnesium_polylepis.2
MSTFLICPQTAFQTVERHNETLETLPSWISEYAVARQLERPAPGLATRIFFTNLFISRVDWWFRAEASSV